MQLHSAGARGGGTPPKVNVLRILVQPARMHAFSHCPQVGKPENNLMPRFLCVSGYMLMRRGVRLAKEWFLLPGN